MCVALLPLSSVPHRLIAMSTTATTVASTIIGITPVVAIVDVLKEQHVLAYFPSPLLELSREVEQTILGSK